MEKGSLQITTILLEDGVSYEIPDDYPFEGEVKHISVNEMYEGWEKIRNEIKDQYICINCGNMVPAPSEEQLEKLKKGKIKMMLIGRIGRYKWSILYQNNYYGYDYNVMMAVLEKEYPAYYKFVQKDMADYSLYNEFAGIFKKADYDKIFDWMKEVLGKCEKKIPVRISNFQNKWREHLAPFLFSIYAKYWIVRIKYELSNPICLNSIENVENAELPNPDAPRNEIIQKLSKMISEGSIETVKNFVFGNLSVREDMKDIRAVFKEYDKQRLFDAETTLDREKSLDKLLLEKEMLISPVIKGKPQILILKWSSFGYNIMVEAFESFGFECTFAGEDKALPNIEGQALKELNDLMDSKNFDVAYSTNYADLFAQACYLHDVPYLAWNYDSPTFGKRLKYITYPTTNIFCFDTDDLENYKKAGAPNAYHLPLAASTEYYDKIICSDEDKVLYDADISFVGQLYETSLPKAMGYLSDYQKAYLGALIDNQTGVYGYDFFNEIIIAKTMQWLNKPAFNSIINKEFIKNLSDNDAKNLVDSGELRLLLNKQTTNKERLLLLTLLAKHHEVKLYADKDSELFKDLKYCGRVDYYTQMPKVFRCSKINLNVTLRSIYNAIPLRCIDIMACGGCLMTNYQRDFDEHFKDGENLLIYHNAEEALEKADFYLAHDTLREKIALSGYETVKKYYSYPVMIKKMLELAGLDNIISACENNRC